MDQELISALNRLADAHARLADNVGRLADSFAYTEGKVEGQTFAEGLLWRMEAVSRSMDSMAEALSKSPEEEN